MSISELESKKSAKQAEIEVLKSKLPGLEDQVARLETSYNMLHMIAGDHVEQYPDKTVVLDGYVYDESWSGNTKNHFYYTVYDEYANSNTRMLDDIITARDNMSLKKSRIESDIRSIKSDISRLEREIDAINAEISALRALEEAKRRLEEELAKAAAKLK